jgi:WD40 repeat protein
VGEWTRGRRVFIDFKRSLDECAFSLVVAMDLGCTDSKKSKLPATSLPPITSLSWNAVSPSSVVTCSIDTTATLWDISAQTAVTQLIAHDKAVYDL